MGQLENLPQPGHQVPEIQVHYQGVVLARRPYVQADAATMSQYLTVWLRDPQTGHCWIDFAQYHPVQDRVRYYYSWDGIAESPPVMTNNLQDNLCQQPCKLKPAARLAPGRRICSQEQFERSIVILLESPHAEEVDEDMAPCAPANGSTGELLHEARDTIGRMLKAYGIRGRELPVIICNPVPYPTSCRLPLAGHPEHGAWRNEVFAGCIAHPSIARAFRGRLLRYQPAAVINACTGYAGKTAKKYVRSEISASFGAAIARPVRYARQSRGRSPLVAKAHRGISLGLLFPPPNPNAIVHIELPHPSDWGRISQWPW